MPEAKTKPTRLSVAAYFDAIDDPTRRQDCRELAAIMARVTKCKPVMWGPSIVGFDRYHYRYASGHEGDSCVVGFSSRRDSISVYLLAGSKRAEARLFRATGVVVTLIRPVAARRCSHGR